MPEMEEIKTTKKRRSTKADGKKITGKIDTEEFVKSLNGVQTDTMVNQEKIFDILVESMKQAYFEWLYPGIYKDKDASKAEKDANEVLKLHINCHIEFHNDFKKYTIKDVKTVTPEDEIIDSTWQISPEEYTYLTGKVASVGDEVKLGKDKIVTIVEEGEVKDPENEMTAEDYRMQTGKKADIGEEVELPFDVTLLDSYYIRRVGQLYNSKIKEASKAAVLKDYSDKMGGIIEGTVENVTVVSESDENYTVRFGKVSSYIKKGNRQLLPGERLIKDTKVLFYLDKVNENTTPLSLEVSRTSPKFIIKLMEREIPEVKEGLVKIKGIAREPGARTKVFVESTQANIDPIGSCIGPESSRQRSISNVVNGEKIDFCHYNENKALQIIEAMKPANVIGMTFPEEYDFLDKSIHFEEFENEREYIHPVVTVVVSNGDQGVAIGSHGSNVRLASRLTKCKLNINTVDDATAKQLKWNTVPQIMAALNTTPVEEKPAVVEDYEFEEEDIQNEEVRPNEPVIEEKKTVTPAVEEKEAVAEPVAETTVIKETPVVEPIKEVKEEPVEHVEIMNKPKISLESLEAALETKKGPSETHSYRRKKKEDEKKEEASEASKVTAMPIYTKEELEAMNDEYNDENVSDEYDDDDYEEYADYDEEMDK